MDVKKKIAYILTDSRLGGTERFLLKILKRLVKTDQYEMNIFTLIGDGALNKLCSELKIKNEFLQFTKLNSLKNYFKLKKSVTKFQPDIIHSFLFHANYFSAHLKKGLITPKLIVSERCLDISKNLFKIKLTRYYSGIADIVTAVSEDVQELLIKREGIPREKITLLKNGIEPSDYIFPEKSTLRNEFKIPDNAFVIINIARFRKEKGQVNLISAFKDVLKNKKDSYLILTGEGETEKELRNFTKKNNLESNVIFTGARNDVINLLQGSDLAVNSSIEEGFSAFNLEAVISETPLIMTDVGGNREILKLGAGIKAGISKEQISKTIINFIRNKDKHYNKSKAKELILETFSFDKIIRILEKLYE